MENYYEINYEKNMQMLSQAIKYCEENLTHQEIIDVLNSDNELKKQLCLIELKYINSQEEADILIQNLTQKPGPVRETASYKVLELISNNTFCHFFQNENILNTFIKAIVDINPSVSRNTTEIIKFVDNTDYLYKKIIQEIIITLNNTELATSNHSYVQNKKNFNLYWNLEALISISDKTQPDDNLIKILNKTSLSNDYTIREKSAKAAKSYLKYDEKLNEILIRLKDDNNIYVKGLSDYLI